MLCQECGFKNSRNDNFCKKCNKKLKNTANKSNKYLSSIKSRKNASLLLKALILIVTLIGISGVASAHPLAESPLPHNLQTGMAQNGTVYIESGFSGVVTVKDTMLNRTKDVNVDYDASSSGTGLIVTKDGYIITAFHVVSDPNALDSSNQKLKKMQDKDIKWYVENKAIKEYITKENPQLGYKLLKNRPKSIQNNLKLEKNMDYLTNVFIKNGWISAKSYEYDIYARGLAFNGVAENPLKARLVDFGDPKSDTDIALLKVNPKVDNLPVFNISSKKQTTNEKIGIYGYPGDKIDNLENLSHYKNKSLASSSIYTPSSVSGRLTAKSPNSHGIIYYETNANTVDGYSGGPVVDNKNNVIGILIYGIYNEINSKKEIGDGSLFLSSNYIIKICNKNKVHINVV